MKITLLGNALSTNHIYKRHNFTIYLSAEGKAIKEQYQWQAKTQWKQDIIYGDIALKVKFYFGDKRERDIDNYNKLVFDALSGIVWGDDKQIKHLEIDKLEDKKCPRIELEIIKNG